MALQDTQPVDDAVPLKPEDLRVVVPVPHSLEACAGAATGFVMRKIAYRAGAYAPGIQEFLFNVLVSPQAGRTLGSVADWLGIFGDQLHAMGYRISARRVMGERTDSILTWIREGKGYRGAVLETDYHRLHPAEVSDCRHAVGITIDRLEPTASEDLVMVDPWPGSKNGARDHGPLSPRLDAAHKNQKYAALIFYWAGWA